MVAGAYEFTSFHVPAEDLLNTITLPVLVKYAGAPTTKYDPS